MKNWSKYIAFIESLKNINLFIYRNCINCGNEKFYLYKGRCNDCNDHYRWYGQEKPANFKPVRNPCKNNCGKRAVGEICSACKVLTGNTYVFRTCDFCFEEELVMIDCRKDVILENWICKKCRAVDKSIFSEERCEKCKNRLFKVKNDGKICVKCKLIESVNDKFELPTDLSSFKDVYNLLMKKRDINKDLNSFNQILTELNELFPDNFLVKLNYMYLSGSFDENTTFEEFLFFVIYIGFGCDQRKHVHLKNTVNAIKIDSKLDQFQQTIKNCLTDNGLIILEYKKKSAKPVAMWLEKCGIFLQKLVKNEYNRNIKQGNGKLNDESEMIIFTYLSLLSMYDVFLSLKSGGGELYDLESAQQMFN